MNAALSSYNTELKDVYGLFAVTEISTTEIKTYFQNSLSGASSMDDSELSHFIDLKTTSFEVSGVPGTELTNPDVLERQMVEYMKYRVPADATSVFELSQSDDAKQKLVAFKVFLQRLSQVAMDKQLTMDSIVQEPSADSATLDEADILTESVSSLLPAGYKQAEVVGYSEQSAMNDHFLITLEDTIDQLDQLTFTDTYLMNYLTEMFSCWTTPTLKKEGASLDRGELSAENNYFYRGEIEYIIWGADQVSENIHFAEEALYNTRFLLNLYNLSASLVPGRYKELDPADQTEQLKLLSEAVVRETEQDVKALINGDSVPVRKLVSNWQGAESLQLVSEQPQSDVSAQINHSAMLNYQQYLKIFVLCMTISEEKKSDMLIRSSQLIQINLASRGTSGVGMSAPVDLTEAYTFVMVKADVSIRTTFLAPAGSDSVDAGSGRITNHYNGVSGY